MAFDRRAPLSRVDLIDRVRCQDSVSNFLLPASYDPQERIYTLADLSLGVALEVTPLPASVVSDAELQTYADAVATALSRLPEHAIVQTTIVPTAHIEGALAAYAEQGGEEQPVLASHERMVASQFRRSVTRPLFAFQFGEGGFKTKRYRIILSVVIRPDAMVGGARSSLLDFVRAMVVRSIPGRDLPVRSSAEERYLTMRDRLGKRLQETARRLEGTLRTNHLATRRLEPDEFIALVRQMVWPDASLTMRTAHDPFQQLATQIPIGDVAVEPATGAVLSDGWVYKTLTMSGVPRATSPGTITLPQQALGFFTLLDFFSDGFLTVAAHCKPLQDMRDYIEKRKRFVRGGFAIPSKTEQLLRDCDLASNYIEVDRRRMFDAALSICVRARSEREAQELAEKVRDKAADIGIDCRVEQHFGPSAFFQSLPFGFAPTLDEARRTFMLPDRAVADFLPLFMPSRGTRRPAMLLHNRLGEPFYLNPFDSPTAAHMVICGESGSGKSFLTNYLIFSVGRRPHSQIFAIDKGRSYATATTMLGERGSYNNMGLSSKTCINAFAGTLEASAAFLRTFIAHLASQVESDQLTSDQLGIVDECITSAFLKKQGTFAWRRFEDIFARWPRGAFIDRMRKRLRIQPLDEVQRTAVDQLKARDTGRAPEFEIYTRALLTRRIVRHRTSGEVDRVEEYTDSRSVNRDTLTWLTGRSFLVEDHPGPDGRPQACILYVSPTQERALEIDGFVFTPLRGTLVLEVARREDLVELVDAGVRVLLPDAFLARTRVELTAAVTTAHPQAAPEVVAEIVAQQMADLRPLGYFDSIDGMVRIQFEVYFSDFIRELQEHRQDAARSIASRLAAYHGNGPLAGFFDGETQFRLDGKKLITFELQELSSAGEHLVAAVVGTLLQMLILYCQAEHLAEGGPRSYLKYIVLDEFWALLAVPLVADLVINGLRTLRKHNTAIICISQLVSDFTSSEHGRIVLSGSQHRVLLRQPPDVVATLDKSLHWTPEQQGLMYSVVSCKGMFSEALVDIPNQGICDVARFVPTPYAYWIFTTAPEDVKQRDIKRNAFRAQGLHADEALDRALQECAERWPHGFAAGEKKRA